MDTTWYYTLSTISQTLAAILGVIAVFVVLRLDGLTKNITDYRYRALRILRVKTRYIKEYRPAENETDKILLDLREFNENYRNKYRNEQNILMAMLDLSHNYDLGQLNDISFVDNTYTNLNNFIDQRDEVVRYVKLPGILGVLTIGISLTLLTLADAIPTWAKLYLLIAVLLSALWSVGRAFYNSWNIIRAIRRLT